MSTFYMRIDKHEDVCIVFKKTHAACAIMCAHEYIRIIRLWKRSKEVPKGKDWAEYAVLVSACSVMLQTFCGDTERNNGNQNNLSQCCKNSCSKTMCNRYHCIYFAALVQKYQQLSGLV